MTLLPLLKYLQFAHWIINKPLKKDPLAKIKLLSHEKLEENWEMIFQTHPAVQYVWGTIDGMNIRILEAPDGTVQNHLYNSWQCNLYVTSILCFDPNWTIPAAFYNIPGCTHGSAVAEWGTIYCKLEKVNEGTSLKSFVYSASCSTKIFISSSSHYKNIWQWMATF